MSEAAIDDPPVDEAPAWFVANLDRAASPRAFALDGHPLSLLHWGSESSPLLVLIHGGAAHASWWAPIAPFFVDDGWQVVAVDLSGHGASGHRESYRIEQWADEVVAAIDAVAPGRRATVVGHSLGSQVAAVVGDVHSDRVDGTVLVDFGLREPGDVSPTRRRFRHQITYRSRDEAIGRFGLLPRQECVNRFYLRYLAETSVRPSEVTPDRWTWHFDVGIFSRTLDRYLGEHLRELSGPVAFVRGADSRLVSMMIVERCLRQLGRPAPVITVPAAAHHIWLDQPLAFVASLRSILATWGPSSAR